MSRTDTAQDRRTTGEELTTAAEVSAVAVAVVGLVAAAGRIAGRREKRPPEQSSTELDAKTVRRLAEHAPPAQDERKPDGPTDLHGSAFTYALKRSVRGFRADQCTDIAAGLVYYAVLAIGPALLAVLSILGLVLSPQDVQQLVQGIEGFVGSTTGSTGGSGQTGSAGGVLSSVLNAVATTPAPGLGLVIGVAGALWSASKYVKAFGRAMNRIYIVEEGRPVWKRWPIQLLLTLAVVVLVVIGAVLLVSTGSFMEPLASAVGLGDTALLVYQVVKWPVLALIAVAAVALLYSYSSNVRQPGFRWTSIGALVALVVWAVMTAAFGVYLASTGGTKYSQTYGPVAGVIIFLLYLWLTNLVLLYGAEFDSELERARQLQAGVPAEQRIQLPPRDAARADKTVEQHRELVRGAERLRTSHGRTD